MKRSSLWTELTICGFIYLLALFFLFLWILGVTNFKFFIQLKDYLVYLSIGAVAFSYILGIITHRILVIFRDYLKLIWWKIKNEQELIDKYKNSNSYNPKVIKIYQLGNERFNRDLDIQHVLLVMSRSLMIGFIILGITFWLWLHISIYEIKYPWLFPSFFIILGVLFFIIWKKQKRLRNDMIYKCYKQIEEIESKENK